MRISTGLAAATLMALAACGQSGSADGNKAGGKAAASGGGARLKPGLYETALEMKMTGLPPSVAKAMEGTKTTSRNCVTEEEANRPSGDLFAGEKHEGCVATDNEFGNGRIRGTLTCAAKANGQGQTTITMNGTYGGDNYDVRTKMVTSAQGQAMTMEGHIVGRRVGECPADMKDS